jgi:glycopeptide antibiotics resistance protein
MKKAVFICVSVVLYLLSAVGILYYITMEFNPIVDLSPIGRLVILCSICLCMYFGSIILAKKIVVNKDLKIMKAMFIVLFIAYLMLIITFTLFDFSFGRSGFKGIVNASSEAYSIYLNNFTNFVPFKTIQCYWAYSQFNIKASVLNLAGNVIAFAPFAFFVPLLLKKFSTFVRFFILIFLTVVSIEILQFILLTGSCDIDDIILNVSGACFLYLFLHIKPIRILVNKITVIKY